MKCRGSSAPLHKWGNKVSLKNGSYVGDLPGVWRGWINGEHFFYFTDLHPEFTYYQQLCRYRDCFQCDEILHKLLILSYLYELLLQRRWSDGRQKQGGLLVRISVGMVSSVLCCCAAWLVEVRRLSMVEIEGVDSDVEIRMSILWLVPQFLLSWLMEELAEDGLEDFFCVEVADQSMESYGEPFTKGILSIGKFVNTLCVFIFQRLVRWERQHESSI